MLRCTRSLSSAAKLRFRCRALPSIGDNALVSSFSDNNESSPRRQIHVAASGLGRDSYLPRHELGKEGSASEPWTRIQAQIRYQSTAVEESGNKDSDRPYVIRQRSGVRNVAIIAHVDHGKTTLVDTLLRACSTEKLSEDRLLDSSDLEKERGITITSKVTRCNYRDTIVNIVDTPGHADFCGEVDRILSLVDGVCLVVDAAEGPMAQTKYVLTRALNLGLKPMVILNKVDRADGWSRIESGETESELLDLFDSLGATEEQMEYLTIYGSARDGWVTDDQDVASTIVHDGREACEKDTGMDVLLDRILDTVPAPTVHVYDESLEDGAPLPGEAFSEDQFSLAAVTVGYDSYLGRMCTGRIHSGSISMGDQVTFLKRVMDGDDAVEYIAKQEESSSLGGIFVNRGISRTPMESGVAYAGDIVTLAGVPNSIAVGDTLTGASRPVPRPVETPPLAPPTLSMEFAANNGPLAGREGTEVTPSKIRSRLIFETDNNVTLSVETSKSDGEKTTVFARGELQLGILVEQMRREGYELIISPPRIRTKLADDGKTLLEPFEEVTVDVDSEYAGAIVSSLTSDRKGILVEMNESMDAKTRLRLEVPSRGLLGFHSEVATTTRGSAVVNHVFLEDRKHVGALGDGMAKGKLISTELGKTTQFALAALAARGVLFVNPGDFVYPGMIIGENAKEGDLEVNPVRAKALTNMRTQGKEEKVVLAPPKKMTVEELIGYMSPDEMIEVTPTSVRLRKAELDPVERRKSSRVMKQQNDALKKNKK
jgi:GTP-binding protein